MIFVGYLIVVSILVRDIEGYFDAVFGVTGGLDQTTTNDLTTDFLNNLPSAAVKMRNEADFCAKPEDEKAAICVRLFCLVDLRNIVKAEYKATSHLNKYELSSYQCRRREIALRSDLVEDSLQRQSKRAAQFIRCPTSLSQTAELMWSDLYVTIDHKRGYYLFGSPWGDDDVQPIAHIHRKHKLFSFPIPTCGKSNIVTP